jgi:hypothetical protein
LTLILNVAWGWPDSSETKLFAVRVALKKRRRRQKRWSARHRACCSGCLMEEQSTVLCEYKIGMIFRYEMRPRDVDPEKLAQP